MIWTTSFLWWHQSTTFAGSRASCLRSVLNPKVRASRVGPGAAPASVSLDHVVEGRCGTDGPDGLQIEQVRIDQVHCVDIVEEFHPGAVA